MRAFFLFSLLFGILSAVELPLVLRTEPADTHLKTRVHLGDLAFENTNGEWTPIPSDTLTLTNERETIRLSKVPIGTYKAIQFSIIDPSDQPALALASPQSTLTLDAHPFPPRIHISKWFVAKESEPLTLSLHLERLLKFPRPIPLDGSLSQASLNSALIANLQGAFSLSENKSLIAPRHLPAEHTPVTLNLPPYFSPPGLPPDNPLTQERITVGERLFFDGIISADGTVTCAACHSENTAFAEDRAISRGFEGRLGKANSMPLFNRPWKSSFFWNGRAPTIRQQVLIPIAHRQEMAIPVRFALNRLNRRRDYQRDFTKAFGPGKITREKLGLALESFILSLTSTDSKYDQFIQGKAQLSQSEQRGAELFFNDHIPGQAGKGAGCYQCHGGSNFTNYQFHNNGIFSPKDDGLQEVTGRKQDLKKFITPSLRNLVHTRPYSHDGRLLTLEEVIDLYSNPPHLSDTLDPRVPIEGLQLSAEDKNALIDFLKTLSDPKY
ncbi:MAG: cytochrome-c peroxidase [Akkermansiaceae bacterium]